MSKHVEALGLRPGDRIVVPKSEFRFVQHHAVYLGQDDRGSHWFAENKIGIGVRLIGASAFFKDVLEVTRINRFTGSQTERRQVVEKVLKRLGLPYNLINYNCEHFANDVLQNRRESEQVSNAILLGIALAGIGLLLRVQD